MNKYQGITCSAVIASRNKTKVLIIKRSPNEDVFPNKWELPSGKVEFGEKPRESLIREVKEETGLDIVILWPFYVFSYVMDKPGGRKKHTIEIAFLCKMPKANQKILLSSEHVDYYWLSEKELPAYVEKEDLIFDLFKLFFFKAKDK